MVYGVEQIKYQRITLAKKNIINYAFPVCITGLAETAIFIKERDV